MSELRILFGDDHEIVRRGLRSLDVVKNLIPYMETVNISVIEIVD